MPRSPSVSSFAPELLTVYHKASQEPIAIPVEDKKAAERLRFRLHQLRRAMRREMHEWAGIAEGCQVTIHPRDAKLPNGAFLVAVGPSDRDILPALKSAGVEVEAIAVPDHENRISSSAVDHYLDKPKEEG